MTPVRLEPTALRSRVKHYTTEPLPSLFDVGKQQSSEYYVIFFNSLGLVRSHDCHKSGGNHERVYVDHKLKNLLNFTD